MGGPTIIQAFGFGADYAEISVDNGGATTIRLKDSWEQIRSFDIDGLFKVSMSDQANKRILVGQTAVYIVSFYADGTAGSTNKIYQFYVFELSPEVGTSISSITKVATAVVTTNSAHGLSNGDLIKLEDVTGMAEVEDRIFEVVEIDPTSFSLKDDAGNTIDSSGFSTAGTDGAVRPATKLTNVHAHRKWAAQDRGDFNGAGIVNLTSGNHVELYVLGETDTTSITVSECSFMIKRVG